MRKKRLLCACAHSPAFDSCFPLIERLQQRGIIEPLILLGPRLRKVEPRAETAVRAAGVPYVAVSFLRLEVFSVLEILRTDALITHSDPRAYGGKFRLRDFSVLRLNKPTVFVQHGMVQAGLHYAGPKPVWNFHANLILTWTPVPNPHATFFGSDISNRFRVTGLLKTNRLSPATTQHNLDQELGQWYQRLLICHNFGFESQLYSKEAQKIAFSEWGKLADSRPNTLFIIRSHRGKHHAENTRMLSDLTKNRPNIILSERHSGLMRMATINDVMAVVDSVITHPSTVVLDAIYAQKHVGVFNTNHPELSSLPHVDTAEQIASFLDQRHSESSAKPIKSLYGEISENLDCAAKAVENYLMSL